MLIRLVTFVSISATMIGSDLSASPQQDIVGTWSRDQAANQTQITFRLDHTFSVAAGADKNSLHPYITGTWSIKDGDLVLAHVEAAGKPLPDSDCRKRIDALSKTKLAFENESYTRVR